MERGIVAGARRLAIAGVLAIACAVAIGMIAFAPVEPARATAACSESDAARKALEEAGSGWAVADVFYDSNAGGYWVDLIHRDGYRQQVFVRGC